VPDKKKILLQRHGHVAAAVTANYKNKNIDVIIFGGWNKDSSLVADTLVVKFG